MAEPTSDRLPDPAPDGPHQRHLRRLRQWRNPAAPDLSLAFVKEQFQREVARPHRQLGQFVDLWAELIPEPLLRHTRLEGFARGVLRVAVDSSAHRYELDHLLRAGLERELMRRQPAGATLRRVRLHVTDTPIAGDDSPS